MRFQPDTTISLPVLPWHKRYARLWMGAALFSSDVLGFSLAGLACLIMRYAWEGRWNFPTIEMIYIAAIFSLGAFGLRGLYPGIGLSPISEWRILITSINSVILILSGISFFLQSLSELPRLSLALFWALSLVALPVCRLMVRYLLSRLPAWGEPVILFGGGARTRSVYKHLTKHRMLGFDPVSFRSVISS